MAQETEFLRRIEDLAAQCERKNTVTHTQFLTPAEQFELSSWYRTHPYFRMIIGCGIEGCERNAAAILPEWMDENDDVFGSFLGCVKITAGFGSPGHRDYLGSILGLGIKREWIGDILIDGSEAYVICEKSVIPTILRELTHVSRYGVKCTELDLDDVPRPERKVKTVSFTVQSCRFDTVVGAVFGMSRSSAVKLIKGGLATLNYQECLKVDAEVDEGDVISLRGHGKAVMKEFSGKSKKGRTFVVFERYI